MGFHLYLRATKAHFWLTFRCMTIINKAIVSFFIAFVVAPGFARAQEETPKWRGFVTVGHGISTIDYPYGSRVWQYPSNLLQGGISKQLNDHLRLECGLGLSHSYEVMEIGFCYFPSTPEPCPKEIRQNWIFLNVPVAMHYQYPIGDGRFSLTGAAGVGLRTHLLHRGKIVYDSTEVEDEVIRNSISDAFYWNLMSVMAAGTEIALSNGNRLRIEPMWNAGINRYLTGFLWKYGYMPSQFLLTGTYMFGGRKG